MSTFLIILVTFIYLGVALSEWFGGRTGMTMVFAGYAFANIGLIWELWR